ncbi:dynein heavy chain and region D6 of dynein motor-domain-containing protein [Globomyces pollinis-pini]|nr:dynein heavy chain and region D6 of dynein motor-domain-containing protein [Globomyces pollinis-pini]
MSDQPIEQSEILKEVIQEVVEPNEVIVEENETVEQIHDDSVETSQPEISENDQVQANETEPVIEEQVIEPIVQQQVFDYDKLYERFKSSVAIKNFDESALTDDHMVLIHDFLTSPQSRKLIMYVDTNQEPPLLCVQTSLPSQAFDEMAFFIRESDADGDSLNEHNYEHKVQYGKLTKNILQSLLKLMTQVYVPIFLGNKKWPDSVRKEFNNQLHKFMAFLTDTTYQVKGHTVLYVPEGHHIVVEDAARAKDVVQRLEALLVHWTRQIKEVINTQHTSESSENSGPLEEIQFWRSRCDDLSGISDQINRKEVQTIIEVLTIAKSSFLEQFLRLSHLIKEGTIEAQENLKFLSTLTLNCRALYQAEPKDIVKILPNLLRSVRLIWANSQHYNTKERLTGLLRKISNEIIRRCCAKISLDEIFHGDVQNSIISIQDSINCGESWKTIYKKTCVHVAKFTKNVWDFDQSSIFAQIDAFVRRCRDLLEVCEGQIQFARKTTEGKKTPIPYFGGSRGPEIAKSLEDIEDAFEKHISTLWQIRKHILDVKATRWHDDYNNFKQGVKDLEVMMQNVIISAFDDCNTIEGAVELLDIFHHLAKRDAIKRTVEKKTADVYQLLLQEFNTVKIEFETNRKTPLILRSQPDFAGSAYWAKSLLLRIQASMSVLSNAYYLPSTSLTAEAKTQYDLLASSIEEYISKTHSDWVNGISTDLSEKLDDVLLVRKPGDMLQLKFDKDLLSLFSEIGYFQKLKCDIPFHVQEVYGKKEELRILRENVLLVVRDYNNICETLSRLEHNLFKERIRFLDRKINPGLTSLTWDSKGITDFYIKECRRHITDVQKIVNEFLQCDTSIQNTCVTISQSLLWQIENKKIYDLETFESSQLQHHQHVRTKLSECYESIYQTLTATFEIFKNDGKEVYNQWVKYIEAIDGKIEQSLRVTVKRSLSEISKAINGEGKNREGGGEVHPLLKVNVVLESQKVDFNPTFSKLQESVNKIAREMISTVAVIPRLSQKLTPDYSTVTSRFYDIIAAEDDVLKIFVHIQTGMSNNSIKCQAYLKNWDSYREIWEINKDAFIRRYAKLKPALSTYDADINRYNEVANNAQKEETLTNINFTRLDCTMLKHSIVSHCSSWQAKLTTLLNQNALTELTTLLDMFSKTSEKLRSPPKDLDQLSEGLGLLQQLQGDVSKIEGQFQPIREMYEILDKYEVPVKESEKVKLESLLPSWVKFQETMTFADKQLHESKSKFKAELLNASDEFSRTIANIKDDFNTKGPFNASIGVEKALKSITEYKKMLTNAGNQEKNLKKGLAVFKIEYSPSKDMENVSNDIESLLQVWTGMQEWNNNYLAWKTKHFLALDGTELEETVQKYLKKLTKMGKEVKDWDVFTNLKDKVNQTKRTIPLLLDLRNPAMRERHWNQIMDEIGKTFTTGGSDFTLDKIFELGLDQHTESISALSVAATKELSIEQGLKDITDAWGILDIDIVPYKEEKGYYKIKSTDPVFELLEDNQVTLSTMKASKFFKSFESQVDQWERSLSLVVEVIETLLMVQRQWMYLENIFVGTEDIRKQLPKESAVFDQVNLGFKKIMNQILKEKNVLKIAHTVGLLEQLLEMNGQLEKIQKSLDMYLETKRQAFPRFYFLSNDDLLEILGQAKDPNSVQPHLKKCFDNLHKLELNLAGVDGRRHNEAIGMHSGDGEYVPFAAPVIVEGPVEVWLIDIENMMITTLRKLLGGCLSNLKKAKKDKWLKDWAGMLLICAGLIQWTTDCTKGLLEMEKGEKGAMKTLRKKQISSLKKFADLVKLPISKVDRKKLIALITIEVHSRDVIDKMVKSNCSNVNAFEWLSQLRFYWERGSKDDDDCFIKQINTHFRYGYEYLGNSGRLVITPLTDRCYMTLTTALHLFRGGSPQGPAGTGKTETVKDLGKGLGKYVIVFNCSDALDYKSIGRMFSGLVQTGAWGCFDEFNRIDIEVLSVVALQISCILTAISRNVSHFVFEGKEIKLNTSTGIFITMNPGYAGRVELPDNLKSLFRPVSMMVPDSALIAEIMLFAEGFSNTRILAKKVDTLYKLSIQQLSKQDHYDFGLRAMTTCLRSAGARKRLDNTVPDDVVLFMAMRDNNIPKLTAEDVPLFNSILSDLFPGVEAIVFDYTTMTAAITEEMKLANIQPVDITYVKILQLYETKCSRHGVMIVGETGSGKSTSWKLLQSTLNRLAKALPDQFVPAKVFTLNPKALSLTELYGEFNLQTNEWTDGVLSTVMRNACSDDKKDQKWIVLDGPVDTLWIESMNTVLDDNKVLTLINGERIALPEQVSLLFEVENLSTASPATVSRCGMIYTDYQNLGWRPYLDSWISVREDKASIEYIRRLSDKYLPQLLEFRRTCCQFVPVPESAAIRSFCTLFDAVATLENGVNVNETETYGRMIELWFLFALIWSLGGSLTNESRRKFDSFLREIEGQFPSKDTVFEYNVDKLNKGWVPWEDKLPTSWRYSNTIPYYKIFVPTVDTIRNEFIFRSLINKRKPVLLVGDVGTGKTALVHNSIFSPDSNFNILLINMSAQTSAVAVQNIIEGKLEKRTKNVYVPVGGKSMLTFIDDFNMPMKDTFGSQPPLEFIKHYMEYGFAYDRLKQGVKFFNDIFIAAAMGPPGGGRNVISPRIQAKFNVLNMTFPNEVSINRIFSTILNQKLQDFEEDVKALGDIITPATIEIFNLVVANLLPTPARIHYLFNLRDISKVFQGIMRANKEYYDTRDTMIKLWIHELSRVFGDRLIDKHDRDYFKKLIDDKLISHFSTSVIELGIKNKFPLFGDFMAIGVSDNPHYEEMVSPEKLKNFVEEKLLEYNSEPGFVQVDLVLFYDAIEHICRITRVLRQPNGNVFLIGVGGSGRQSLTRLASYLVETNVFQIKISKNYRHLEFREDLKRLFRLAGVENKPMVFLLTDAQIVHEVFLEDLSNILSSGEVPNLFGPDELPEIKNAMQAITKGSETTEQLFSFFIERVRNNLHIVLCMSPVGDTFRRRLRMFPSLVNCMTIDWFSEWPEDALMEVASKYLADVDLGTEQIKKAVSQVFVTVHTSVVETSIRMIEEIKRYNYVTPINYLELVNGYRDLLKEKRKEIGDAAGKLKNGLSKLDDTRENVQKISVELEVSKKTVAQFQKQCEDFLVVIVQQKREADDTAKSVAAKADKLGVEEAEVKLVADAAQADLDEAIPALNAATKALENINRKDLNEIKSYAKPPPLVEKTMEAVMVLKKCEPTWDEAKRQLGNPNFIKQLVGFDKDNISDKILKRISQVCADENFQPDIVGRVSIASKSLCMWVRAMETYGIIFRQVAPKKEKLRMATETLEKKQKTLREAKAKLQEIQDKLLDLKNQYDEKAELKERLRIESEQTELKLTRAEKLVSGLAGERDRWEKSIKKYEEAMKFLPGDCLLAAAFMSYAGPFNTAYRQHLVNGVWINQIKALELPFSPDFSFDVFIGKPTDIRDWNIQGLPSDAFSAENGIIVTRGRRWPLMIDPQGQANNWIRNMEKKRDLKVIDLKQHDFLRTLENAIQFGLPVILQGILEVIDPALDPILNKSVVKKGGILTMKLGEKEIEYNPEFRFYITTKMPNPKYSPEVFAKVTIVNFAVKERGLEDQLLGILVKRERPDLEEQKSTLVTGMAAAKRKLVELEDEILYLLSTAQGSLLDDEKLVNTLQSSKTIAEEVTQQLLISEQTEKRIDVAREAYRPAAQRASILYFVLNDMSTVDPMYQFSLEAYIEIFDKSISKAKKFEDISERIASLNEYHTFSVYKNTCRGLFEKHKLLFSLQMTVKIMEAGGKLNKQEYDFFLRGGQVLDKDAQPKNPCSEWLTEDAWDNLTELEGLASFSGLISSFEQNERDWKNWFLSEEPDELTLPGDWENKLNDLQKMLVVRSIRTDRVIFCAYSFISNNLGQKFVEPPILDVADVLNDSSPRTPLIFVLSPGVDPTLSLQQLAQKKDMGDRFNYLSLGQGQAPKATKLIQEGLKNGNWVFLANCHLSISYMPTLDKIIESIPNEKPHPDFRIWLSSSPHPQFPISILQSGLKMTTEPPKGLKANLTRIFTTIITEDAFSRCTKPLVYRPLLFALCFFHSVLLERKKFLSLGWNVVCDFNDSDFDICENLTVVLLEEYTETPWEALKYLIAEANYGGRVTDDWDRRILRSYINHSFNDEAISTAQFKLSTLTAYYIPDASDILSFREYISGLPNSDKPEVFGQHPNADIASQIRESNNILDTLLSLQPQVSSGGGISREEKVLNIVADISKRIPDVIDYEATYNMVKLDMNPFNVVLLQEIKRYNDLLNKIRKSLFDLQNGLKGIVVMTSDLEETFGSIFEGKVPPLWSTTYSSLKPLAAWVRDLVLRIEFFNEWSRGIEPKHFWLGAFTFPTGFLTAVLQRSARKNNVAVDALSWEFHPMNDDEPNKDLGKEGIYIRNLYLEGASWDRKNSCLKEPKPMELITSLPPILFRPVESKKKSIKGFYTCPLYIFPIRSGTRERPSFIIAMELKSGGFDQDFWIKRGAACLTTLA